MPHGIPTWIPPAWRDPQRRPLRNHAHHQPIEFDPVVFDAPTGFDAPETLDAAKGSADVAGTDNAIEWVEAPKARGGSDPASGCALPDSIREGTGEDWSERNIQTADEGQPNGPSPPSISPKGLSSGMTGQPDGIGR
jgi:hypothetical protein